MLFNRVVLHIISLFFNSGINSTMLSFTLFSVFSVLKLRDERNVVDSNGNEVNKFTSVPLETLMKYVDSHKRIGVRIIEGSPYNDYTSWEIYTME